MDRETTTSINELNAYLKGEYMAIDSYEKYIEKLHTPQAKEDMNSILKDHKEHAHMISERIKQLGGNPVQSVGISGKMGELMNSIKNIGPRSDEEIFREASYWEEKGTNMAHEIVKGDLDPESGSIIENIINTDRSHIDTLKKHFH